MDLLRFSSPKIIPFEIQNFIFLTLFILTHFRFLFFRKRWPKDHANINKLIFAIVLIYIINLSLEFMDIWDFRTLCTSNYPIIMKQNVPSII
jgi:hypothetical protein